MDDGAKLVVEHDAARKKRLRALSAPVSGNAVLEKTKRSPSLQERRALRAQRTGSWADRPVPILSIPLEECVREDSYDDGDEDTMQLATPTIPTGGGGGSGGARPALLVDACQAVGGGDLERLHGKHARSASARPARPRLTLRHEDDRASPADVAEMQRMVALMNVASPNPLYVPDTPNFRKLHLHA